MCLGGHSEWRPVCTHDTASEGNFRAFTLHAVLRTTHITLILSVAMLPVRAFDSEPSPRDKSRPSKLSPLSSLMSSSCVKSWAKVASPKGQALTASAGWTGWNSSSDLLQSKLQRVCQLLETAPGGTLPRLGTKSTEPGPQVQFLFQLCH